MQVCSATVWVNTLWKWCPSVEESVAPLTLFPPALEVNLSSYYFPPVSYTRWLPLEHESNTLSSSLRVCSFRRRKKKTLKKALIPKKWNRQKFLPLHLTCVCLICRKKYPILPEHNVARGQSFDISRGDLIHVLLQQRKRHFTGPPPLCTEKWKRWKRRVIPPSVTLLTPCYLKVTTGGRKLSWGVFHKAHLSFPHHMCSSRSFLQTRMCLQLKIVSHHKQEDKNYNLLLYFHCHYRRVLTRESVNKGNSTAPTTSFTSFQKLKGWN